MTGSGTKELEQLKSLSLKIQQVTSKYNKRRQKFLQSLRKKKNLTNMSGKLNIPTKSIYPLHKLSLLLTIQVNHLFNMMF